MGFYLVAVDDARETETNANCFAFSGERSLAHHLTLGWAFYQLYAKLVWLYRMFAESFPIFAGHHERSVLAAFCRRKIVIISSEKHLSGVEDMRYDFRTKEKEKYPRDTPLRILRAYEKQTSRQTVKKKPHIHTYLLEPSLTHTHTHTPWNVAETNSWNAIDIRMLIVAHGKFPKWRASR